MAQLTTVANGQLSDASMWNQYRSLFTGGHVFDVVAGYGADNTGVADASTAISSALTAAAGKGTVYFPAGTYLVGSGIYPSSNTSIVMDPQATLLRTAAGYTIGLFSANNVTIRGGRLDLPATGQTGSSNHIAVSGCSDVLIRDVWMGTQLSGSFMTWISNSTWVTMSGCHLINPRTDLGQNDGIHIAGSQYVSVDNCVIQTGDDAISIGSAGTETAITQYVTVSNCNVVANSRCVAVYTENSSSNTTDISVTGISGRTLNVNAPVLAVQHTIDTSLTRVTNVVVSDFSCAMNVAGSGEQCMYLHNVSNVSIDNSLLVTSGNTNWGMIFDNSQACRIANSTITGNATGTAEVNGADYNMVVGCYLHGNTTASSTPGTHSIYSANLT